MASARDGYERYLAEKLWELIPAVYRDEDGRLEPPGQLRAFIEVVARHGAVLRRSTDRLWDDVFIDLADDWVVPYLGDLVATRMVSALNPRGRRVDVAKTIYYRRRKGTPRVLEELISDITGWDGRIVEEFRRLGRFRHGLDPDPAPLAGLVTGTMPGGLADLRRPAGATLADGPFDEFHHTPDVRRPRGRDGRYAIPRLGVHVFRIPAHQVAGARPVEWPSPGPGLRLLSIDPSGRDVPLFMPRHRPPDWDQWTSAREWELPQPIRCRVLAHAEYVIDEGEVALVRTSAALPPIIAAAAADELARYLGVRFRSEGALRRTLATLANGAAILTPAVFRPVLVSALVPDCGKAALLPAALTVELAPGGPVPPVLTTSAYLGGAPPPTVDKQMVVDPERGRLLLLGVPAATAVTVTSWYGFPGPLGAGGYARPRSLAAPTVPPITGGGVIPPAAIALDGVTQIDDSLTYTVPNLTPVRRVTLQAADRRRPYVSLGGDWVLDSAALQDATVTLTGLWIGGRPGVAAVAVILQGDFERVVLRHATLDPGGVDAQGGLLPPVQLVAAGQVEELVIEHSIVGPIRTQGAGAIESLVVRDSIVQSTVAGVVPVALPASEVRLERVTVLVVPPPPGQPPPLAVDVNLLEATETLSTGVVDVTNTQAGCFRFSAAVPGSRLPRPYESHVLGATSHVFTSRVFGQPGYAQLSETAPAALTRGAENGSEIGAFSSLMNPIKQDSLLAKLSEYMPFGLVPVFIAET
jgi:hypothetical protein